MIKLPSTRMAVSTVSELPRAIVASTWLLGPARRRLMAAAASGDLQRHQAAQSRWARRARALAGIDLRVVGSGLIDPDQPYVVAPLHEGFADAVALLHLQIPLTFVARRELLGWPHLGGYLTASNQLLIDPEDPIADVPKLLDGARSLTNRGASIVMFPQGSIIGIEAAFQPGAAWLAQKLEVPILPVVLAGSHRVWEQPFSPRLRFNQPVYLEVMEPVAPGLFASLEIEMKDRALTNGHGEPRRYQPEVDGYWDGYSFAIDPAFPDVADAVARHRARLGVRRAQ